MARCLLDTLLSFNIASPFFFIITRYHLCVIPRLVSVWSQFNLTLKDQIYKTGKDRVVISDEPSALMMSLSPDGELLLREDEKKRFEMTSKNAF